MQTKTKDGEDEQDLVQKNLPFDRNGTDGNSEIIPGKFIEPCRFFQGQFDKAAGALFIGLFGQLQHGFFFYAGAVWIGIGEKAFGGCIGADEKIVVTDSVDN